MSQSTNITDLNEEFSDDLFSQYYDEIFRTFPLPINIQDHEDQGVSDEDIVEMKMKWIVECFVEKIKSKSKMKEMVGPILDLVSSGKERENVIKNMGNIKIMLKHCEIQEVVPLMTETIMRALWHK